MMFTDRKLPQFLMADFQLVGRRELIDLWWETAAAFVLNTHQETKTLCRDMLWMMGRDKTKMRLIILATRMMRMLII